MYRYIIRYTTIMSPQDSAIEKRRTLRVDSQSILHSSQVEFVRYFYRWPRRYGYGSRPKSAPHIQCARAHLPPGLLGVTDTECTSHTFGTPPPSGEECEYHILGLSRISQCSPLACARASTRPRARWNDERFRRECIATWSRWDDLPDPQQESQCGVYQGHGISASLPNRHRV